ncbi:hypothetical protein FKM82_009137 [Ascaphus truei]
MNTLAGLFIFFADEAICACVRDPTMWTGCYGCERACEGLSRSIGNHGAKVLSFMGLLWKDFTLP